MKPYITFELPAELSPKPVVSWTKKEAQSYLEWLVDEMDLRVCILLSYFGHEDKRFDEVELSYLATQIVTALKTEMFSEGKDLTDFGYALAADAGLLVAKKLLQHCSNIHWKVGKGPKSAIDYNKPVLEGFGKIRLDPVGGMIAELKGVIRGDRDETIITTLYDFWKNKANSSVRENLS